ncbi:unnamed protein product [Chilo suppressalis]|uniref:Reverse transcriptase domain-containing protein n=1 Tax=Chilo suppressalis TaxID=168631 RepID=A0ABN8AZI3_CHISP|nr:unnamed protein product [Chilo suppressalis]
MPNYRCNLPDDARELLRAKNASTRAFDICPTDNNRSRLRTLQRAVKARMKEMRESKWDELLEEISPSHQAYWKLTRSFKSEVESSMPPLTKHDRSIAFNDDEKAKCLADSLEAQCSVPPTATLETITVDEVHSLIRKLHPRCAPGSIGISSKVLKILPAQLLCLITAIFNAPMTNATFPAERKKAVVIGFRKPGKDGALLSS